MFFCTSDHPAARRQQPHDDTALVWLQTEAASAASLRRAVIRAGGDAVRFLRIDACTDGRPVRALLCVQRAALAALRTDLLRRLPSCAWHEAPRRGERHVH